jgi:hypothetical protein
MVLKVANSVGIAIAGKDTEDIGSESDENDGESRAMSKAESEFENNVASGNVHTNSNNVASSNVNTPDNVASGNVSDTNTDSQTKTETGNGNENNVATSNVDSGVVDGSEGHEGNVVHMYTTTFNSRDDPKLKFKFRVSFNSNSEFSSDATTNT